MRNLLTSVVVVFCIGAASGPVLAEGAGQITVTGEGMVSVAPDVASIALGVTTQAETAAEALSQNNAAMKVVMERLKAAGIEPRDLQTSNLQLQPNWVQEDGMQSPVIRGYIATNLLSARVRDLTILGSVLDAAVKDGANTMDGLNFEQSDPKPSQTQARKLAVEDAKAKASELVTAAGASLGKIVSITEGGGYPQPMMLRSAVEGSVDVAVGEIGISQQVTIVFEIVQ